MIFDYYSFNMAVTHVKCCLQRTNHKVLTRFVTSVRSYCHHNSLASNCSKAPSVKSKCEAHNHVFDHFSWMSKFTPCYKLKGEQVLVITEPTQFYEILKLKTRKAKRRITLASLYIGTGCLEHDLVDSVQSACADAQRDGRTDFRVNVLLDYTRGSRGREESSRTMLQPLLTDFPDNVAVSLYHTPDLRGLLKRVVPERYNETIGLTHLKVYLFDDSVLISGANLSDNYFTNRQDRYILFSDCKELADFFDKLVQAVSSFSLKLKDDNTLALPTDDSIHPFKGDETSFKYEARKKVQDLLLSEMEIHAGRETNADSSEEDCEYDTWVYPLIQMGPIGIRHDETVTLNLFRSAGRGDEILLASGYFNLTDHFMDVILLESHAKYGILLASPEVNSFFHAKGFAGYIPTAYIHIARQFFKQICRFGQNQRIQLFEYFRDKWTFHAKGLWYYLPGETLPCLTFIGSPNFGYRSVYRDLECQLAVVTTNKTLSEQLREEHVRLFQSSTHVTHELFKRKDRHVPLWARFVTAIIKNFF